MKNVMFVCEDNTYSQIAEAWMYDSVKENIFTASAGLSIGQSDPNFVRVMHEVGLDISGNVPKILKDYDFHDFDTVISLCTMSMRLPDQWMMTRIFDEWILPQPDSYKSYRQIRDDIRDKVDLLLMRYSR